MYSINDRKGDILKALVTEYIFTAEPIGSTYLAEKYGFGVKSATIRNELSEMLDLGFLEQPHTSAGRIPTHLGYRYYVNHLISKRNPKKTTKGNIEKAIAEGELLKETLLDVTYQMSRFTKLLCAACIYKNTNLNVLNVVLSNIGSHRALLVIVFSNGDAENRIIEFPMKLDSDMVSEINRLLVTSVQGKNIQDILNILSRLSAEGNAKLGECLSVISKSIALIFSEFTCAEVIMNGEEYLFAQPEVDRDIEFKQHSLDLLRNISSLAGMLTSEKYTAKKVVIGKEHDDIMMQPFSLLKQPFHIGVEEAGVLAIIGPTRMDYDFCIPLLEYASKVVSDSFTNIIGK